jgi:DNA-binding NtrC family response regulator
MADVAVLNSSDDVVELLRVVLQQAGHRVVTAHLPDIKRGDIDLAQFVRQHDPLVIVYDIPVPYEQNWTFFKLVREAPAMQGRAFVLTTTHKVNLERLVGPTDAIEIVGKPFDLNRVVEAVNRAAARTRGRDGEPPPR